jgi:hypothetical protein
MGVRCHVRGAESCGGEVIEVLDEEEDVWMCLGCDSSNKFGPCICQSDEPSPYGSTYLNSCIQACIAKELFLAQIFKVNCMTVITGYLSPVLHIAVLIGEVVS